MKSVEKYLNTNGEVIIWPKKHADKQIVCEYLVSKFDFSTTYHEREINEVVKKWHTFSDWPLLRREMVERKLLKRNIDGTEYNRLHRLTDVFHYKDLTCRGFVDSDTDTVVELINHAFAYQDEAKGSPRTTRKQMETNRAKYNIYTFYDGDQLVGCVYTQQTDSIMHFGLLVLADHFQGTGAGEAIVNSILEFAKQSGCKTVDLDYLSVAPWLKKYYEKFGFRETGKREAWLSMEMIQMNKQLN